MALSFVPGPATVVVPSITATISAAISAAITVRCSRHGWAVPWSRHKHPRHWWCRYIPTVSVTTPRCSTSTGSNTHRQKNYQQSGNNHFGFHNYLCFGYSISDTILKPRFKPKTIKFTIGLFLTIPAINQKLQY